MEFSAFNKISKNLFFRFSVWSLLFRCSALDLPEEGRRHDASGRVQLYQTGLGFGLKAGVACIIKSRF
jgi:hypothetical protein